MPRPIQKLASRARSIASDLQKLTGETLRPGGCTLPWSGVGPHPVAAVLDDCLNELTGLASDLEELNNALDQQ